MSDKEGERMTLVISSRTRYGGLMEYKKQTPAFSRVFRALLSVLERTSRLNHWTPEASLRFIQKGLPLGDFEPIDIPIRIDIHEDSDELRDFLNRASLGRSLYVLQVCETLLRLPTRNGIEALFLFEEIAADFGSDVPTPISVEVKDTVPQTPRQRRLKESNASLPKSEVAESRKRNRPASGKPTTEIDNILERSKATLAKTKETLAESGQVVITNPLLSDFL